MPGVPYEVEVEDGAYGKHTLEVRAMDEMGNVDPTPAKRTWTYVDLNAPDTEIETLTEEETEGTIAVFDLFGEDILGQPIFDFECSLDESDFVPCETPYTIEGLTIGPHVFQARAVGPNGVVDPIPEIFEWLVIPPIDLDPPDTIIAHYPLSGVSGPDVLFGFQSNELVEEFECAVDGEQFSGCDAVLELEGLEAGQHTIEVRAMDIIENVDPTPARFTWTVVGEPETTITSAPPMLSGRASATFTFTSDQANVTFMCSVDGSIPTPCTSPFIAGPLAQDGHEFEVYAMNQFSYLDGERVQDQSPAQYEWEVQDVTPPDTELLSVVRLDHTDLIEPDSFRFELRGSDNATPWWELEFECQLDNGPWDGCDTPFHYLPLEEIPGGQHVFRIRAMDEFENVDPTPVEHHFTTEAGPETTILSGPDPETGDTTVTFDFAADPALGARFECSLDLAPFTDCPNPYTLTVPFGEHELEVRAKGPMGAVDLEPAVWSWASGDVTPPVITIHSGPAPATTSTDATFAFTVDDPEAALHCSLDGGPLTPCESPLTYDAADLALASGHFSGIHTLAISATKLHLLAEAPPVTWEWRVDDLTAPETTIDVGPPAEISLETVVPSLFAFSSNEPGVTFECSLDPVGIPQWSACAGPPENTADFSGLEAGNHRLLVRAVDPMLNADATPAEYTWAVLGPALTTITGNVPAAPATTTTTTATFSWTSDQTGVTGYTCSLDGAVHLPCTSPVTVDAQVGNHEFEVQSTNKFALLEEPPAVFEWTVEVPDGVILPETSISSGPLEVSNTREARFTFSSDQTGATFQCSLDLGPYSACTSPLILPDVAEGEHVFNVRARQPRRHPRSVAGRVRVDDRPAARDHDRFRPADADAEHRRQLRLPVERAVRRVRVRARRRDVRVVPGALLVRGPAARPA